MNNVVLNNILTQYEEELEAGPGNICRYWSKELPKIICALKQRPDRPSWEGLIKRSQTLLQKYKDLRIWDNEEGKLFIP